MAVGFRPLPLADTGAAASPFKPVDTAPIFGRRATVVPQTLDEPNLLPLGAAMPLIGRVGADPAIRPRDAMAAVRAQTEVTSNELPLRDAVPFEPTDTVGPPRPRSYIQAVIAQEGVTSDRPPPAAAVAAPFGPVETAPIFRARAAQHDLEPNILPLSGVVAAPFEPIDTAQPPRARNLIQVDPEPNILPLGAALPFAPLDTAPPVSRRAAPQSDVQQPFQGLYVVTPAPFEPIDTAAPVSRRASQQPDNAQNTLPLTSAPPAAAPFLATDFGIPTPRAIREIPQFLGTWAGLLSDIPPAPVEPRKGPADDRRRRKRRHPDPAEIEAWRRHREEREKELERIAAEMLAAVKDAAPEDEPAPPVVADATALLETPEEASNARIRRLQVMLRRLMVEMDRLGVALDNEDDEETALMLLVA